MLYTENKLKEISFPLGGIGTGSIGLSGNGSLIDWEIYNRPNKGSINPKTCFAIRAEYPDGKVVTKILQGDWTKNLIGQYTKRDFAGYGYGPGADTMCAFPHFKKVTFDGQFPVAKLTFEDELFPGKVIMRAFNPFIPLDADNSSIPAAFFDIAIENASAEITYTIVFSVGNPFSFGVNTALPSDTYTAVQLKNAAVPSDDKAYGDLTVALDHKDGIVQEYWYRGAWMDAANVFWHELSTDTMGPRTYDTPAGGDTCSVGCKKSLAANASEHFRFVVSWNIPNNYNYWEPAKDENGNDILWKNYYAVLFKDSTASARYALDNWDMLYEKTEVFRESLHSTTLDPVVIEAVSSTISVLKSPTVLRLEDGSFYGWEGVHELAGSCEGTCTHVWSYAYALCFLFPELERSIRNVEFQYDVNEDGSMPFRTKLPLGYRKNTFRSCVDGQMATIIKTYREWKISGDDAWLKKHWETVKKVLAFTWSEDNFDQWDRDRDGVLEGRQHHTLDMEMFGPSSWLQGMYLAALKAAAEMAEYLDEPELAKDYLSIFEKGYQWTKENLFNGSYFIQKIDLTQKEYTERFDCANYWNDEKQQLKYQIGEGSSIDQMLGQWHASICGLGDIFDKEQRSIALKSMVAHNFKESLREHPNPWRVFALNDEAGTVICAYPEGSRKPIIPIPYTEECMTGFEYSFAGLLISEGYIEEGLKAIRAIRDRYDGEKRNPWNEIECGNNYARPMASFALLPIFSGFTFHLPKKHIGFSPIVDGDFKCLFSLGTGWGEFIRTANSSSILMKDGTLELTSAALDNAASIKKVIADGREIAFTCENGVLHFTDVRIEKELKFQTET